jgi:hypothetical protein
VIQRNQPDVERVEADRAAVFGFDFEMFLRLEDLDPLHLLAEGLHKGCCGKRKVSGRLLPGMRDTGLAPGRMERSLWGGIPTCSPECTN